MYVYFVPYCFAESIYQICGFSGVAHIHTKACVKLQNTELQIVEHQYFNNIKLQADISVL